MKPAEIAVIGAGMGGLAAASLLARDGHRVTLMERFAEPRPLGSGLVVQPVGLAVLEALDLRAMAEGLGAPLTRMLGHAGRRPVLDVRYPAGAPGLAMHRASLFHVLWSGMQASGVRLVTGARVTAVPLCPGGRQVETADGPLGRFDLVVDASGAGSVLSPLKARALSYGAVWGHVPWPETALPRDELRQRYRRADRMAGILPIGHLPDDPQPRAAVFWSLPRAALADWPQADFAAWKAEAAAFWPELAPFLAALTDRSQMTPALYGHGTLRRPYAQGLAFIGDAAHRASPQLGQGANMALLDAFALALALRGPQEEALPEYARLRRWHVRLYQAMSAMFTPAYQSGSRLLPPLRDHLLAPLSQVWPMPAVLTRLVAGDLMPPLASTRWPPKG